MALANVALTNTFDEWRTRTNQLVVQSNYYEANLPSYPYANNIGVQANAFTSATIAGANALFTATIAGANSAVGLGANAFASATIAGANTTVGLGANAFASATIAGANSAVGVGANNFTKATMNGANTTVGLGANAFASATIAGANSAVGLGANTFASATIAGANTAARDATNLTSGTIPVARVSGNYNLITGLGTIASGTWQGSTVGVAYGGTGQTTIGGIQSALGLGSLAYLSSVGTSNITDNSVNGAKIALGSDATGDLMYFNGTDWARLAAGSLGQALITSGTSTAPAWVNKITTLETKTTSGLNAYDFTTGIPTWARRVTITFKDIEASSTIPELLVQLGTQSGGFQTSSYVSYSQAVASTTSITEVTSTAGFIAYLSTDAVGYKGIMTLTNITGYDWMQHHLMSRAVSAINGTGYVTLGNPLYSIRVTLSTLSTYTFSGGSVTVLYE